MKNIVVTGGTGLVGSALVNQLKRKYNIYILTRSDKHSNCQSVTYINWNKNNWEKEMPNNVEVVINLAGASLMSRWTKQHKEKILNSRIESTRKLYNYFKNSPPKILFNASAVGYYPPSLSNFYDEYDAFSSHDFLSTVTHGWEEEAKNFDNLNTRVIIGRFGIVLSSKGGALQKMKLPYIFFVGGPLGLGKQWMSWIHIEDLVDSIQFLIQSSSAKGVYNLTSPYPKRENMFGKSIGLAMKRPHWLITPKFMLKLALGEQSYIILNTQKVYPTRLLKENYQFKYAQIQDALNNLIKK